MTTPTTHTYHEITATHGSCDEQVVLYGSFARPDCVSELETERENWIDEGYRKIRITSRQTSESPDPEVYGSAEIAAMEGDDHADVHAAADADEPHDLDDGEVNIDSPAHVRRDAAIAVIKADFAEWSGGFLPDDMRVPRREAYAETSAVSSDDALVREALGLPPKPVAVRPTPSFSPLEEADIAQLAFVLVVARRSGTPTHIVIEAAAALMAHFEALDIEGDARALFIDRCLDEVGRRADLLSGPPLELTSAPTPIHPKVDVSYAMTTVESPSLVFANGKLDVDVTRIADALLFSDEYDSLDDRLIMMITETDLTELDAAQRQPMTEDESIELQSILAQAVMMRLSTALTHKA
jgi:hypothetical protein